MLRLLDRLEEVLIATLIAVATVLIFLAVTHRFAIGFAADLVGFARAREMTGLADFARSMFMFVNSLKMTWAQEACIYLFVWMAKFGAAYGVRTGIHVGVDILAERLTGNKRRAITTIAMSGGILFTAILTWIGTDFVYHVRNGGQTSPDLEMPMWIIYLAVPLGSALMCFRFVQALHLFLTTGEIAHHDHGSVDGLDEEAEDLAKGGHA
ncbi:TRAP transporter small permease subunit [Frigidibacter albus]|uniref:TRAP transporter small permease protein n=1 Tax=Frigidibacter albus TaxID=1465486 RepID=A0A6L8VJJ1_9RHOB|nr:TRAP transporter small permease [Frigidibacter albus]MZQ90538.1 TRAP transporter small permease subunit [Frigidibacter albus]NBE32342.1 TRAP transporter small permease subunit [Frigidibacter albus]GGH59265.1 C4-dicarboxylate ABC transporter substrate-binding protein [Frigidibacter albus]